MNLDFEKLQILYFKLIIQSDKLKIVPKDLQKWLTTL